MRLKSQIGKLAIIALSVCSTSVFAVNEQIKCPSIDYVKSNFTNKLAGVFRLGENTFTVKNSKLSSVVDKENNLKWRIDVGVITNKDYDFNDAYKKAPSVLSNITKADKEYAHRSLSGGFCQYLNKAGQESVVLTAEKLHDDLGFNQLSIVNATHSPMAFTVNNSCSDEIGTVNEAETKNIPNKVYKEICHNFTKPCTITAYYGKQCAGKPVGGVTYNNEHDFIVNGYVEGVTVTASPYMIAYSGSVR